MNDKSNHCFLLLGVAVEGGLGIVAIAIAVCLRLPLHTWFAPTPLLIGVGGLAVLPMLLGLQWLWHCRRPWTRQLQQLLLDLLQPLLPGTSAAGLLLIAVLAGAAEELLFRGCLQTPLVRYCGLPAGLLLTAAAFAAAHALSFGYAAVAGMLGLYLGLLVHLTASLLPAVIAHALYDFVALLWFRRALTAPPQPVASEEIER